jgi:hypothetical protein
VGEARMIQIKELGHREVKCIADMYGIEGRAKRRKVEAESKASLKELKLTRDLERKCISNMWKAEEDTRVECLRAESKLRMELMREEMRLKMELIREDSSVRRGDGVIGEAEGVLRESARVAKRRGFCEMQTTIRYLDLRSLFCCYINVNPSRRTGERVSTDDRPLLQSNLPETPCSPSPFDPRSRSDPQARYPSLHCLSQFSSYSSSTRLQKD